MFRKLFLGLMLLFLSGIGYAEYEYTIGKKQVGFSNQEAMNSNGDYFTAWSYATLITGASSSFLIDLTTATKAVYLDFEISTASSTAVEMLFYKDPEIVGSSGTLVTTIFTNNWHREKKSDLSAHLYWPGNITSEGTNIYADNSINYANPFKTKFPIVLKPGTAYLIKATNKSIQKSSVMWKLYWYMK